jgi:putative endonuclease
MYYIYILHSPAKDRFYIGSTSNPEGRLIAHNHPQNKGWTKRFQPWIMVYNEAFDSKSKALAREKLLKSYKNKDYLKKLIAQDDNR